MLKSFKRSLYYVLYSQAKNIFFYENINNDFKDFVEDSLDR